MNELHLDRPAPGRGVMKLYLISGLAVVGLLLLAGLAMRSAQAGWLPLQADAFYSLLTLHGAGMIVAMMVCAMGAIWFLTRQQVRMSATLAVAAWILIMIGVAGVLVATLVGRYGSLYTFLYPLPFRGTWPDWSTGVFLIALVFVNAGWMIWCCQMLAGVLRAHGGYRGALGWDFVWHSKSFAASERHPPPPESFPAFMVGLDGLIAGMAATLLGVALVVRWIDPQVQIDPLWAKNLTYFWAHTVANLIIYMLAGVIYVALPLVTRREYHVSKVFVVAWWASMTLTLTNYFHHLYMDFAQPEILQYAGQLSSYLSALPVTVVTVYGALMLVWRSGMRWTLGAIFFYTGMLGWVVGGIGAEIDASVPFNVHLHNTLWVPAHFHTYLLGGCLLFVLGWVFLLLESRATITMRKSMNWLISLLIFGGMLVFLLSFYFGGAYGVPRRYSIEPAPGPLLSQVATVGAAVMIVGMLLAIIEGWRLWRSRRALRAETTEEVHG